MYALLHCFFVSCMLVIHNKLLWWAGKANLRQSCFLLLQDTPVEHDRTSWNTRVFSRSLFHFFLPFNRLNVLVRQKSAPHNSSHLLPYNSACLKQPSIKLADIPPFRGQAMKHSCSIYDKRSINLGYGSFNIQIFSCRSNACFNRPNYDFFLLQLFVWFDFIPTTFVTDVIVFNT